ATEDTLLSIAAPGVLGNDTDPANATLSAVVAVKPLHGTLTLNANGSFSYQPSSNFNGTDSFTYRARNQQGNSCLATVTLSIAAVNDAPTVNAEDHYILQDTLLTVAAPGVLTYAHDADGDSLTAVLVNTTKHGTLTLDSNGSFTYMPAGGYVGTDSFDFRV